MKNTNRFYVGLLVTVSFLTVLFGNLYLLLLGVQSATVVFAVGVGFFGAAFSIPYFFLKSSDEKEE
jgi:hypothetical protein